MCNVMNTKMIIPWNEIKAMCLLATAELSSAMKYDFILGVAKGGLCPSAIMGNKMGLPVLSIMYSADKGNGTSNVGDKWSLTMPFDKTKNFNILVVEDICDTGNTLKELVSGLEILGNTVTTYCVAHRAKANYQPDLIGRLIPDEVTWVDFPWE